MRRAALLIVVVVAVAGGAMMWLRGGQGPSTGSVRRPSTGDASSKGSSTDSSSQAAGPTLHLDTEASASVVAGTPVFFTITLEQSGAQSSSRVEESWLPSLRFETSNGAAVPWRMRQLGAPHVVDVSEGSGPPADASAASIPRNLHFTRIRYGIDPDSTARIAAGIHTIRVSAQVAGTRVTSDEVRFQVNARSEPALSSVEWLQMGRFHLEAQEFDLAHTIALKLVETTDDTDAYALLGDVFTGLGRHEEALAAYIEALASMKTSENDEPPDRILLAVERARDRIGSTRR